jgi:hypothetical protein
MISILLRVRPAASGWVVESSAGLEPLRFHSGARAEAQANAFAEAITRVGSDARVVIHDRSDRLVGSRRFFAADPADQTKAALGLGGDRAA